MLSTRPPREFTANPRTVLAAVLLFDQIPRNIFRNEPDAFAHDCLARQIAKRSIVRGLHRRLDREARGFLGMALMHSEAIADQRASLAYFRPFKTNYNFARALANDRPLRAIPAPQPRARPQVDAGRRARGRRGECLVSA